MYQEDLGNLSDGKNLNVFCRSLLNTRDMRAVHWPFERPLVDTYHRAASVKRARVHLTLSTAMYGIE